MLNLASTDAVVLILYLIVTVMIGSRAARHIKTREDFFMGSRRFGKLLTAFSTFGAGTHADTAVAVSSETYNVGLAGIWYQWIMLLTLPIYWLLAPVFRRARVLTTADFFEARFGRDFMILYSIFGMFVCTIFTAVLLFGSARLVEALTAGAITKSVGIFSIGIVAFSYGIVGGLIAAVWNDLLQGIMTIVMSTMMIPFFWLRIGGLSHFRQALPDPQAAFRLVMHRQITPYWIFAVSVASLLSMVVQPHIMSNAGSTKSEMDSRVGFTGGLLLKRCMSVPWALTGVMAIAMYGAGNIKGDLAFGILARDLLPAGFSGLMVAGVLAAAMSSSSVLMLSFSALWTNNIYRRFINANSSESNLVSMSRITSAIFGVCSLGLSFAFGDMPGAMRFIWKTLPLMGIAFFLGIFWRRANRYGAFASFGGALVAMLIGQIVFGWHGDAGLPPTITLFVVTGTLCGIAASYLTNPEAEEQLDRFYLNLNTPVLPGEPTKLDRTSEPGQAESTPRKPGSQDVNVRIKPLSCSNWNLPMPSREGWVGFLVCLGIVATMITGLNFLAGWLAGS